MPSIRINNEEKNLIYFVTCTIKNWYHLFDRHNRFEILEDCFVYCQKFKNLKIYAFVFMTNHIHFVAETEDMGALLRDMKTFLSKKFKKNIINIEPHVLKIFEDNGTYQFWEKTNYPKVIKDYKFLEQKVNYIHQNPVKKGYVNFPEDWKWSSVSKIPTKIKISKIDI